MSHPSVSKANKYARDVVAGKISVGKWIRLACQKHLDDLREHSAKTSRFVFDKQTAEKACNFIQRLPHTKGKWAAKKERIVLEPWQCFFVCVVFGWLNRSTMLRRYRTAALFVPRKNGKSILSAAIGLYMLSADNEFGAEVFSGATTEKQAWEVFKPAKLMAERTDDYREFYGVEANASNICQPEDGSKFEPIVGNPGDGSSPHLAIIDEYHEHKTDAMFQTMLTGMGAREQPLMLPITTAGDNISGPCYQLQVEIQRNLEGIIQDDSLFGLIYTIDEKDDWTTEEALVKANPNYGVSIGTDFLENQLQTAINNSRKQQSYKTKHLNVWVGSRNAYFNMQKWKDTEDSSLKLSDYAGKPVYLALDLASKVDIAALSVVIPVGDDDYIRFGRYYLPQATIEKGTNEHYQTWLKDGWLTQTDGEMIDFEVIEADILELCKTFEVQELAYDPFQATMLVTRLMSHGLPVVEVGATVRNFSEPMKILDGLILSGRVRHNGDPVYSWMLSNVEARIDAKDNVFPRKSAEREENKIDGVVADIMAFSRVINEQVSGIDFDDFLSVKL